MDLQVAEFVYGVRKRGGIYYEKQRIDHNRPAK